ncbi:Protein MtfA [Pandoraea eparura]|jgi:Mlc titration factor MtfA (ptsG expression regulator)|uniref:Protein MtfA n=1 Tax=Pandoraea eparura TaxID=2508291 RepID=A0A5E4UEL8_9BURK|nr:M90 family metallopeptidase [Pandoraea eparura]VVD98496.1 Protein MtfA [Pandoraea eparura]
MFKTLLARLRRAHARPTIDDAVWHEVVGALPFLARRSAADVDKLRGLATEFLGSKHFSTAHDLPLTEAMCVSVAAQACLPILNLPSALYRGWTGIVLYPGEFLIRKTVEDDAGVVHDIAQEASGEAWEGGPVVLSWQDVQASDVLAYNVVIHEFVHKIDMEGGEADGVPPMLRRLHGELTPEAWCEVFDPAYEAFCHDVSNVPDAHWDAFASSSLLDPYATEHESEFFAVCAEAFFVAPEAFRDAYPSLYTLFSRYFLQDPAASAGAGDGTPGTAGLAPATTP